MSVPKYKSGLLPAVFPCIFLSFFPCIFHSLQKWSIFLAFSVSLSRKLHQYGPGVLSLPKATMQWCPAKTQTSDHWIASLLPRQQCHRVININTMHLRTWNFSFSIPHKTEAFSVPLMKTAPIPTNIWVAPNITVLHSSDCMGGGYLSWLCWSTAVWVGDHWHDRQTWRLASKLRRRSLQEDLHRTTAADRCTGNGCRVHVVNSTRVLQVLTRKR